MSSEERSSNAEPHDLGPARTADESGAIDLPIALERLRTPLPPPVDLHEVADRLALVHRVRGWLDGVEAGLVQTFDTLRRATTGETEGRAATTLDPATASSEPPAFRTRRLDDEVAFVQRSTRTHAAQARRRAHLLDELPSLSDVLSVGGASGEHVDAVAGALSGLPASVRNNVVAAHADVIAEWAAASDPNELSALVRALADQVAGDAGASRRDRQRRDARMRTWIDRHTQMVHFSGRYDPANGVRLQQRLARAVETLFHDAVPDDAPDDPAERQDFLRAHALLDLTLSTGGTKGAGGEIVVIVDAQTLCSGHEHTDTLIDVPGQIDPTEIDVADVRGWLAEPGSAVVPVVLGSDGVVVQVGASIPATAALVPSTVAGQLVWDRSRLTAAFQRAPRLDLGRTTRLASHAQRIALRVMHPTCIVPDCTSRFEHGVPHHVRWWVRDRGPTDLENLAPLCHGHHDDVHHGGWTITVGPDRGVHITAPGVGTVIGPSPAEHHDALRRRRRAARAPNPMDPGPGPGPGPAKGGSP